MHTSWKQGFIFSVVFFVLLVLQSHSPALAGDASLTWNAPTTNTDGSPLTDLAGFKVYYGTSSGIYSTTIDVGNQTTYTVTGLGTGTFYFTVTAYDSSGNESGFSNEGSKTFADTTPPVISAIGAGSITSSGATITWTTNEASDTQVQYGITTAYGSSTTLNSTKVTSHSQALTGLLAATLYHYRVLSRDAAGNLAASGDNTFTTLTPPDTTPPVISGIASSSITTSGATISWTTNEASDTQVQYGITTAYGSSTTLNSTKVTSHSQALTGLLDTTLYHYRVLSRDAAGNLATSSDSTFTTLTPPDTTPPVISGIASSSITTSGATIAWTTDELSDTQVQYGTTTAYGSSTTLNSTKVTSHSQALTGLQASTLYHYRVLSRDAAGNLATSGDGTFTTSTPPDTTPPVISGITASNITNTGAIVTWSTNEASSSQVEYGTTTAYGSTTTLNSTLVTSHSVTLAGLAASTTYHYRVKSADASSNLATSGDNTFTTSAAPDTTPPVISIVASGNIQFNSANITWTTNEASSSQVEYGTTTAYGSSTTLNSTMVTGHSVALTGLSASTTYHFRVKSADAASNLATSGDNTFTTPAAPDTTPPVISNIGSGNITSTGAAISWTTNEQANTQVQYGTTTAYGSSTTLNSTLVTSHSQSLTGLQASTAYHYRVLSRDASGNLATSGDKTFTTSAPPDTTPPVLSLITAGNITSNSAAISWGTNEQATTQVEYGLTAAYGNSTTLNATLSNSHSVALPGLAVSTTYHYRVKSADAAGNLAASGDFTFTTLAMADTTPPGNVTNFTAKAGAKQITLSWTNPSDTDFVGVRITYRTDHYPTSNTDGTLLGDFTGNPSQAMSTVHSPLLPGVGYYYAASTYDSSGNYQHTAYASATVLFNSSDPGTGGSSGMSGGCGMIRPTNGKPQGPGQAADMVGFLAVIVIAILKRELQRTKLYGKFPQTSDIMYTSVYNILHVGRHVPCLLTDCRGRLLMKRIDHFLGLAALTLGILILSPAIHEHQAIAGEAVLTWDQSPGPDVAGYKIYFGTASHLYGSPINAGNKTTFTFTGLDDGTYYFSVTAYDTAGNESGFSNEASKTISAASSVPSGNSQASSSSGGCGMVNPKDGTPPGPGQAADMVGLLAMTLISILRKEIRVTRRFQMNKLQYRHIILASIPLLLTLIAASANATTYYVNQNFTGASDSNSGTDATHPFLTIARAVCGSQDCINSPNAAIAAKAGDTVIVASGTYYQSRTNNDRFLSVLQPANSGTAGNPLTIKAQTQYGVVITYAVGVTGRGPLIGAYERNYVSWDGVVVQEVLVNNMTDTGPVVFAAGSANNRSTGDVLQNSEVIGVDDNGSINDNHNGIRLENTNNVTINNNKIHGVQYNHNGWQPSMIMMYAASGVTVQNNDIYMVPSVVNCCGGYGVYPKGGNASDGVYGNHNITIRYNLIHDVGTGIKQSFTAQSNFYQNILYNIDNVAFENAESCNNLDCSANTQYSDFPGMANIDINFYNNTIYNAYQGITFYSQPDRALGGGADWRNNIIYMTQNPANMLGSDNNTNGGAYITYQNFTSDYSDYFACCGSPVNGPNFRFTATNQTLSQWRSDTAWSSNPNGYDVHSMTSDPLFVNAAAHDFHLQANSPTRLKGIDFGNILGGGTTAPINMGAYVTGTELIGLTTQNISPSPNPPQNLVVK